uniref:Uncharacterized protein n=1 Tax=viral metagenome TaxID=1070528 RepID=A0A6C0CBE7_9ZZZZ
MSNSYVSRKNIEKETYFIHNNGFRPFEVIVTAKNIIILACDAALDEDDENSYSFFISAIDEFEGYWYGYDSSPNRGHNNTLLIKISDHDYMHIGPVIFTFKTTDKIIDYISPLGNSDVAYPVAYGKSNIYFMNDFNYVNKKDIRETTVANAMDLYVDFSELNMKQKKDMRNIVLLAESQGLEITKY